MGPSYFEIHLPWFPYLACPYRAYLRSLPSSMAHIQPPASSVPSWSDFVFLPDCPPPQAHTALLLSVSPNSGFHFSHHSLLFSFSLFLLSLYRIVYLLSFVLLPLVDHLPPYLGINRSFFLSFDPWTRSGGSIIYPPLFV